MQSSKTGIGTFSSLAALVMVASNACDSGQLGRTTRDLGGAAGALDEPENVGGEGPVESSGGNGDAMSFGGSSADGGSPENIAGSAPDDEDGAGVGGAFGTGGETNDDGSGGTMPRERSYLPCEVEVILATRCRGCHSTEGTGEEPNLESYQQVRSWSGEILDVIADDFMPFGMAPLEESQKKTLRDWVAEGAPSYSAMSAPDCE